MIIYSVTVSVEAAIRADWLSWMEGAHIPDVMATGCFTEYILQEVTEPAPQYGTFTFNVQYACVDLGQYEHYIAQHAPKLREEHQQRYGDKAVGFRTLLKRLASGTLAD